MSSSRETVRDALSALLNTALVGSGKPAEAEYGYPILDFQNQSPIVLVASAGSERDQQTLATRRKSFFSYTIIVLALYVDSAAGWTEADAEDAIDRIEATIDQTIAANLVNGTIWADIGYSGKTTVGNANIGGKQYRYELIPVKATVFHD